MGGGSRADATGSVGTGAVELDVQFRIRDGGFVLLETGRTSFSTRGRSHADASLGGRAWWRPAKQAARVGDGERRRRESTRQDLDEGHRASVFFGDSGQ